MSVRFYKCFTKLCVANFLVPRHLFWDFRQKINFGSLIEDWIKDRQLIESHWAIWLHFTENVCLRRLHGYMTDVIYLLILDLTEILKPISFGQGVCIPWLYRAVFIKPGPGCPPALHILCLHNQTQLVQLMSSLEETPGCEMGVSDKGDIHNVQCGGAPRNWVEKHCFSV